jgi:GNAT superfamily N-acetyltransferase
VAAVIAAAASPGVHGGRTAGSVDRLLVHTLYVRPAFRGLGLARLLLERLVEAAREGAYGTVSMDLFADGLVLEETAEAMGFETVAKRVELDLE